jgi:hypothetical protein
MPHLHISTGTLFVSTLGVFGITGLLVWAFKRPKQDTVPKPDSFAFVRPGDYEKDTGRGAWRRSSADYAAPPPFQPTPASAPYYGAGPSYSHNDGLLTGLVLGEVLAGSHHDTTVIHDRGGSYNSGSYDSAMADSGLSYSDSSSSGSDSGIDISW